jgi:hypothetical protein
MKNVISNTLETFPNEITLLEMRPMPPLYHETGLCTFKGGLPARRGALSSSSGPETSYWEGTTHDLAHRGLPHHGKGFPFPLQILFSSEISGPNNLSRSLTNFFHFIFCFQSQRLFRSPQRQKITRLTPSKLHKMPPVGRFSHLPRLMFGLIAAHIAHAAFLYSIAHRVRAEYWILACSCVTPNLVSAYFGGLWLVGLKFVRRGGEPLNRGPFDCVVQNLVVALLLDVYIGLSHVLESEHLDPKYRIAC